MGRVVSFLNNKGGVAKTTSVFNIGVYWAKLGKKILFIDLDSQANLTTIMTSNDERFKDMMFFESTIENSFRDGPKARPLPVLKSRYENIDFVPASLKLSEFDKDTFSNSLKVYLLKDLIKPIKEEYDFIMIDCPPALGSIITNALIASDDIIIVTTADQPSLDGTHMIASVYSDVIADERLNPNLKFDGCLVTKVENDLINKTYIKIITAEFGLQVITPYIRKSTKLNQACSIHTDIFSHDPNGKATKDYADAAIEVLARVIDKDWGSETVSQ